MFFLLVLLVVGVYSNNFKTAIIVATNDIHGTAFPTLMYNSLTKQYYNYGGLVYMAKMIEIIKEDPKYKGNVIYLDAGDQFQGGI